MSSRGGVTGECVGLVSEEGQPGIRFCAYTDGIVDGGDAELAERNAPMVRGNGRQSMPEGTSRASQVRNAVAPKSDVCVRRSLMKSASIETDRTGSPRLMNRTATGEVMLDVDLREIEQNVADDYEYTEDEVVEGFTILSSGRDFDPDEMIEYVDDRPAPEPDADAFQIPTPTPPTAQPPPLGPARSTNRREMDDPATSPAPAPAPASSPRSTPAREVAAAPTPAAALTPSTVDDMPMRGRGSRANRRAVISEELVITMHLQDA